jgi:hypothetical protein
MNWKAYERAGMKIEKLEPGKIQLERESMYLLKAGGYTTRK